MNRQNFNQAGGFPLQTETLDNMQKAYELFNAMGNIAGNFSIVLGCEVTGALVNNGVVYINGELLEFRGGQLGTDVIIVEEITSQEFEDGNDKDVLFVRYATFGVGLISYPWSNFKRPKTAVELTEDVVTINGILPNKADVSVIQNLINRITYLEGLPQYVNPIKNKGYFTLGDITGGQPVGSSLPFSGDCVSAIVAPYIDGGNHYIDVTFSNAMPSVNYKVKLFVESLGNISTDNDAGNPVFKVMTANKFRVGLYEASSTMQSIRIHFEVSEL